MITFNKFVLAAAISLSFAAHGAVVDFESDAAGAKPNGFSPVGHPSLTLSDSNGSNLQVANFGSQGIGKSLAVFGDDTSALELVFGQATNSLSLAFGNDDPGFVGAGGLAYLQLFMSNVLVGEASTVLNRNDVMDQTVSFSGVSFDRAVFAYTDANKNRVNLIEIVDNITFDVVAGVPEPGALGLVGLALAGAAAARRRRA